MNLKKVGLAAILSSAFAFVACDNSVAANNDTTAVETQPALSSESNGDDTVTSSEDVDLFASSSSVATGAGAGGDTPASSASTISYANDPATSSSSVAGDAGGMGGGDMGGFGGGDMGAWGGGDMGGFGGGDMGGGMGF